MKLLAVARLTLTELRRQRLALVAAVITALLALLLALVPYPENEGYGAPQIRSADPDAEPRSTQADSRKLSNDGGFDDEAVEVTPPSTTDPAAQPTAPPPQELRQPEPRESYSDAQVGLAVALGIAAVLGTLATIAAATVGGSALAGEIERGTMLLLATRPVPRSVIVLGKALGIVVALAALFGLWGLLIFVMYGLRVGPDAGVVAGVRVLLAGLGPMLFAMVALALSARIGAKFAGIAAILAMLLANAAPSFVWLKQDRNFEFAGHAAELVTWVLPSGRLAALADQAAWGVAPGADELAALLVIAGWTALAVLIFARRANLSDR